MGDIDYVSTFNEEVRRVINDYFPWDEERRKLTKHQLKEMMLKHPDFAQALIDAYAKAPVSRYNFITDPKGECSWYLDGKRVATDYPLEMRGVDRSSPKEVARAVCTQFKHLVEDNGIWRLLYDESSGKPGKERYAQLLFFAIASVYCDAYAVDIDVSPEPNSGNGPVDFKLSHGRSDKCLVELKMSGSSQLRHCVDVQIPTYMKAEGAKQALCLLVQTGNEKLVDDFMRYYQSLPDDKRTKIELLVVDARPKESASKREILNLS